jgi:signal transduction histidine kinase/CheY-like chemotaxis protein
MAAAADILLVDDNPNNVRSLSALLQETGANVVSASSGDEALRHLLQHDFALILLDVQMPGLDGYATAELVRSRKKSRRIPIIFLTAFNRTEEAVAKGYSLGAVDFLFKPVVPEILRAKVKVFLELSQKTKEAEQQAALLREAERRAHDQQLAEARREFEKRLLEEQMARERKIAEELASRAEDLANLVAQKERAENAQRKSHDRLALLSETAQSLLMGTTDATAIDAVCRRLAGAFGFELFACFGVVEGGEALKIVAQQGYLQGALVDGRIPLGVGVPGTVAARRRRVVVEAIEEADLPEDPLIQALGIASLACFPLAVGSRLLGCVAFGTRQARAFSTDDVDLMQGASDQIAAALERDRLLSELRDRDRRKDEFLAMLSHELRNPLAPICTAIELMRMPEAPKPMVERALGAAERQVQHMTHLLNDLLDVSRITQGKVELKPELVDLKSVVEHAVQTTDRIVKARKHRLSVSLPPHPVRLVADATRLSQIVANLLHNAAKYTDEGGRIDLSAAVEGDDVVLRVKDDGIGIRAELLPRVFDVFVQAEPTSDRAQGGLGLGLTLVKKLVEMHGGRVEARSAGLHHGSEFVVHVPLRFMSDVGVLAATFDGADPSAVPPMDILLVDDSADIRATLKDMLELQGHRVKEAEDGPRAVEMLMAADPSVAFVDIGLPGLDGYAVAAQIVLRKPERRTRLVALTGYGRAEEKERALGAGFDAHLVKPVSARELKNVLKKFA